MGLAMEAEEGRVHSEAGVVPEAEEAHHQEVEERHLLHYGLQASQPRQQQLYTGYNIERTAAPAIP